MSCRKRCGSSGNMISGSRCSLATTAEIFIAVCPIMLRYWRKHEGDQPAQQYTTFLQRYSPGGCTRLGEGGTLALRLQGIMFVAEANERTVMRLSARLAAIALALVSGA